MKLIDTNVFVYSVGSEHPLREACRQVLLRIESGRIAANIDVELLQEVLNVYQYRRDTRRGLETVSEILDGFPHPLLVGIPEILGAARILVDHPRLQSRDAIHAAVVFENNLEGIISTDRGLDVIAGLVRFDPKELAA